MFKKKKVVYDSMLLAKIANNVRKQNFEKFVMMQVIMMKSQGEKKNEVSLNLEENIQPELLESSNKESLHLEKENICLELELDIDEVEVSNEEENEESLHLEEENIQSELIETSNEIDKNVYKEIITLKDLFESYKSENINKPAIITTNKKYKYFTKNII